MTETELIYPIGNYSVLLVQDGDQTPSLACAALLVLLVLTLMTNSLILLSILCSPLRSDPCNASIACITATSVLDGMFNVTSSIVFHASWADLSHHWGESAARRWCRANATALQITGMVHSFVFAAIVFERQSLMLSDECGDFREMLRTRERLKTTLKAMLLLSVFASAILALPVAFGLFATSFFEQRMSCSPAYVSREPANILTAALITVTYTLLWSFTLRSSCVIVRNVLKKRRRLLDLDMVARQRALQRRSPPCGVANPDGEAWNRIWESANSTSGGGLQSWILTGLLVASFVIAVVPNIIAVQVTQFYSSYDDSRDFHLPNGTVFTSDLNRIRTDIFDSIFAWTRYGYNIISAGLILLLHDEIRKHCRITFCCCLTKEEALQIRARTMSAYARKPSWRKADLADYRTPVLFATSQGLHLRTVAEDSKESDGEPQFLLRFCDLYLDDAPRTVARKAKRSPKKILNGVGHASMSGREIPAVAAQSKLNETFTIKEGKSLLLQIRQLQREQLSETYVKFPKALNKSIDKSRDRNDEIELEEISRDDIPVFDISREMKKS